MYIRNIIQSTHCISVTKDQFVMPFSEIIAVYSEKHTKRTNTFCMHMQVSNIKSFHTHTYQWAVRS